jgi:hypothetical protein
MESMHAVVSVSMHKAPMANWEEAGQLGLLPMFVNER